MKGWRWHGLLQAYGGAVSASNLNQRGVDLCIDFLEAEGFVRAPVAPPAF